ncbi:MAG: pantetheine-phosphate adenylyltransferase [Chloroflexaceae bacterium]|nr:pantetheine-phosphate adenylyltransferase [Chloroflexaceae bacterium]
MTLALYPGSFDPVTNGHLDAAARAVRLFQPVIMAVFDRPLKNVLFSVEERVELLRETTKDMPGIQVQAYTSLTVDYAREIGAKVIVRGLRDAIDFAYEFKMAQINQTIDPDIDVVFFMANGEFSFLSSSTVREIAALGGDVSGFVPPSVAHALARKFGRTK